MFSISQMRIVSNNSRGSGEEKFAILFFETLIQNRFCQLLLNIEDDDRFISRIFSSDPNIKTRLGNCRLLQFLFLAKSITGFWEKDTNKLVVWLSCVSENLPWFSKNIIPEIATHWAFGKDKKRMYFKLNPNARWSDGEPVTAQDFAYTVEFMRSEYIVAPWYNDYYTREIDKVIVYDRYTLAVVGTKAKPDLHMTLNLNPTPRHFFGQLDKDFVRKYNWKVRPNTGPYQISDFKKGKSIKLKRKRPDCLRCTLNSSTGIMTS